MSPLRLPTAPIKTGLLYKSSAKKPSACEDTVKLQYSRGVALPSRSLNKTESPHRDIQSP